MNALKDFALAWGLLTVIPLPFRPTNFDRPAGYSVAYYPLVGLGLGLLLAGAYLLLYRLLPVSVAAALLLILWAGLTGLLHLEGVLGSCDGLLPARSREQRLDLMQTSHPGRHGVVGVGLLLLLKYSALVALPAGSAPALIVIPVLARWAMTWQMGRYRLARRQGLNVYFGQGLEWPQVVSASLVTFIIALSLLAWPGVVMLSFAWLLAIFMAGLALARLDGLTGDVYGATCEVVEVVLLLGVAVAF